MSARLRRAALTRLPQNGSAKSLCVLRSLAVENFISLSTQSLGAVPGIAAAGCRRRCKAHGRATSTTPIFCDSNASQKTDVATKPANAHHYTRLKPRGWKFIPRANFDLISRRASPCDHGSAVAPPGALLVACLRLCYSETMGGRA